jgi:ribosomal protein S6--L-glutamate ligase/gamma-F420-2:alpha-L-glutamate ligase
MKGLVLINGYPCAEKFYTQSARIATELKELGVDVSIVKNGELSAKFSSAGEVSVGLNDCQFAVYLDKDKYLGDMLESVGIRLFNSANSVETCDDKMRTFLALNGSGLKFPATSAAPLCYTKGAKVNVKFLQLVVEKLGFPVVVKKSYGSFGEGVKLAENFEKLQEIAQEWLYQPHFFQEYIAESKGRDLRVIVIGGKAIGCMERRAQGDEFRSNVELGGVGVAVELPEAYKEAAERAATVLGLDYCGVDLLETSNGPVLCEVNSNAFFEGFEKATGLNVAKAYAEHIVKEMQK